MEEKKYYFATAMDPEFFDYELYYNEDEAIYDEFWAGGNSDFKDINADLRDDAEKLLQDLFYDVDNVDHGDLTLEEIDKEVLDTIKYYVRQYYPEATNLSDRQLNKIINLAAEYNECKSSEENDVICDFLEIVKGKEFVNGTIRGNSQSDWMEYICPADKEKNVDYIESVLFATGTEFAITENKITRKEYDEGSGDVMTFSVYTNLWADDDIKKFLCEQVNCQPDEMIVIVNDYKGKREF